MTIAFFVLVGLAVLFAAYWLWSVVADFSTGKLQSYEEWSDRFFSLSGRLLDKDDLPEEWLEAIKFLNDSIDDKIMPMALARAFSKDRLAMAAAAANRSKLSESVTSFIDRNPDLTRSYVAATRSAFLAMTFLAPINVGEGLRAKVNTVFLCDEAPWPFLGWPSR